MVLRVAVLAAAVLQILADWILSHGEAMGEFDRLRAPTLIQPPEWAFAIWGPIFAGGLVYAALQAWPRYAAAPLFAPLRAPSLLFFLTTFGWLAVATSGPVWLTVPLIAVMLGLSAWLFLAAQRVARPGVPSWVSRFTVGTFGLAAGWLALALPLNVASLLPLATPAVPPEPLAIAMLCVAILLGAVILAASRRPIGPALALLWGLVAIVAQGGRENGVILTIAAIAIAAVLAILLRRGGGGPGLRSSRPA